MRKEFSTAIIVAGLLSAGAGIIHAQKLSDPSIPTLLSLVSTDIIYVVRSGTSYKALVSAITNLFSGPFVSQYGADLLGGADATAATLNCLAAAGNGGTCHVDQSGVIKLLGNLTIPTGTTLDCGVIPGAGLADPSVSPSLTGPRILLDSAHSILFGGVSAAIQNCVIVPNGMTFPQTSSSAWVGTAINTAGKSAPQLINLTIAGFDTCINTTTNGGSLRPLLRRIYCDANGVTNGGAIITGNGSDVATLEDIALQALATSSLNCNRVRQGTGLLLTGATWGNRLISQDFLVADFNFAPGGDILIGDMWTDDTSLLLGCSFPADVGLIINQANNVDIKHLDLNANFIGMKISNQGQFDTVHLHDVFLNGLRQDGIVLGAASGTTTQESAGHVQIDNLVTNQTGNNVTRYAVNYVDASFTTTLTVNGGRLLNVNGAAAPYINIPQSVNANNITISPALYSDLAGASSRLYGTTTVGSCTGLGTGTCSIQISSRVSPFSGVIILSPTGSPSSSGVSTLTFPLTASDSFSCLVSYAGGWSTSTAPLFVSSLSGTTAQVTWSQTGALTAGNTYGLNFSCLPQ